MSIPTVYRHFSHTDHEHNARVAGFGAGWEHANYADAYGSLPDTELPARYADAASIWREAYQDGKDEFEAQVEDESIYGHDWRG